MDIIKKLRLVVDFGYEKFQVGQGEWKGVTFNDKHRWVFPLVPNACAYAKLDEYFRKLQTETLRFCKHKEILESQEARKVSKSKQNRARNRMGNFTNVITDLEDSEQNSLTKAVRMISGPSMKIQIFEN